MNEKAMANNDTAALIQFERRKSSFDRRHNTTGGRCLRADVDRIISYGFVGR